jgi:hypothetical protein
MRQPKMQKLPALSTIFILLSLFFGVNSAFGWTEPVEIGSGNWLAAPRVAAAGESLYVIAVYPPRTWFLYSLDNGAIWSQPFMPIDTSRRIEMPTLKYSNGLLHLVWSEKNRPLYYDLFHSQSTDGGRSWSQPNLIFNNSAFRDVAYASLATNGDSLFVAFKIDDLINTRGFLFFRSFDGGSSWQDSTIIDQGNFGIFQYPRLLYSNGIIQFIYPILTGNDSVAIEVYLKRSTDLGLTWSEREYISPVDPYPRYVDSQIPSATVDSAGRTLVTWMDYANGSMCGITGDIFYRVSLDNGETWQPWGSITNTQSGRDSAPLIVGDKFHVGWDDFSLLRCSDSKEAYSYSIDLGQNWSVPQFISGTDRIHDVHPALTYTVQGSDTILHYFFDRNEHLYYMRDHDFVGINEHAGPPIASAIELEAYPNPFNSTTRFNYSIPEYNADLKIVNVQGQLVKRIKLSGKNGCVVWDSRNEKGNDVASGQYYAILKAGADKKTIQITLVR